MSSQIAEEDRLDALDAEIANLEVAVVEADRDGVEVSGDEHACDPAGAAAMVARLRLLDRLLLSNRLNRAFRKAKCSAHGSALYAMCDECRVAWRFQVRRVA